MQLTPFPVDTRTAALPINPPQLSPIVESSHERDETDSGDAEESGGVRFSPDLEEVRLFREVFDSPGENESPREKRLNEIGEVILGSKIEETPAKFKDRSFSMDRLPNCFDLTPISRQAGVRRELSEISSIELADGDFFKEYEETYQSLLIYMSFSDDELLKYSTSQKRELAMLIEVFLNNSHRVKPNDGHRRLAEDINARFIKPDFENYFT